MAHRPDGHGGRWRAAHRFSDDRVTLGRMTDHARSLPHVLRLLLGLGVLGAMTGLLFAGLAMPAVGAGGQVARGGVDFFNSLPSEFAVSPLAQQSRILDADGKLIANPYDEYRIIKPLSEISPLMQKAQLAIEDSRFYEHGGLDVRGFSRAMFSNFTSGDVQGASTITQQYVKITLQENALQRGDEAAADAAVAKNYSRKLQELKYALDVEQNFTKDQILTNYLNLVYYGDQAHGVEAAALNYFGVPAKKLTLVQSALLAGIVQQPTAFNPVLHPEAAQERRDIVLDRMVAVGSATAKDAAAAKKIPVKDMLHKKPVKGVCHRSSQPYFCAYVLEWLQKSPHMAALGKTPAERLKTINQGGLTIRTTLKPGLQKAAQNELTRAVPIGNKNNLGGGATVIEPGTGKVLAMAQASDFAKNQVNWNVDAEYGGGELGYQFGSTAKMYALVTALERGMPLGASIKAPAPAPGKSYAIFEPGDMNDACGTNKPWEVNNHGSSGGQMSLATGTANSVNSFFASLVIKVGPCNVRDTMTRMGMHKPDGDPIDPYISDITLGSGNTNTMTLASSYATLAAAGKYCEPFPIVSITNQNRKAIKIPTSACKQVIDPGVAAGVTQLLEGVLRFGTATGIGWNDYRPAAGKTGTTEDNNQIWFAGYTRQLSTAVWIGNKKPADKFGNLYSLNGKCFGSYGCYGQVFGATVSAPVWAKIMKAGMKNLPAKEFPNPTNAVLNGDYVDLPSVVGRSEGDAKAILKAAGFSAYVAGRVNSTLPAGVVAFTDPTGRAIRKSNVGLFLSNGIAPAPTKTKKATTKPGATPTKKK